MANAKKIEDTFTGIDNQFLRFLLYLAREARFVCIALAGVLAWMIKTHWFQ